MECWGDGMPRRPWFSVLGFRLGVAGTPFDGAPGLRLALQNASTGLSGIETRHTLMVVR